MHLFVCPDLPPLSTAVPPAPSPPLANFIAYTLHRTRLHSSVTSAALYLLARLKSPVPCRAGLVGAATIYFGVHDRVEGDLRRHLLEQVLVDRRLGYVRPVGDQPDRAQDVLVPGVTAQHRAQRA